MSPSRSEQRKIATGSRLRGIVVACVAVATTVAILAPGIALAASAPAPANPNADKQTRAVLRYLESLPERHEHRVVSGQFLSRAGPEPLQIPRRRVIDTLVPHDGRLLE